MKKWIWIGIILAGFLYISVMGAGILLFINQMHSAQSDP
jgi:amino acid permease